MMEVWRYVCGVLYDYGWVGSGFECLFYGDVLSRSRRKPYGYVCGGEMRWWKKMASGVVRRMVDVSGGMWYKRVCDTWTSPCDGPKKYIKNPHPSVMRK